MRKDANYRVHFNIDAPGFTEEAVRPKYNKKVDAIGRRVFSNV